MKENLNRFLNAVRSFISGGVDGSIAKARAEFREAMERNDIPDRIESRYLEIPEDDVAKAMAMGVTREDGYWIAPDNRPLSEFYNWFPRVDEDLRDETMRMISTSSGVSYDSVTEGNDAVKGDDSLAMPLIYAALPVIGAFSYFLSSFSLTLAGLTLLLTIPYLITIAQSEEEGLKRAVGAFAVTVLMPMGFALILPAVTAFTGLFSSMVPGAGQSVAQWLSFVVAVQLFAIPLVIISALVAEGTRKGFMSWAGSVLSWYVLLTALAAIIGVMPAEVRAGFGFAIACLYPMAMSEREYMRRSRILSKQSLDANMTKDTLLSAPKAVRAAQAKAAFADKSAKLDLGAATGKASQKGSPYSPDKGSRFVTTMLDFFKHVLIVGGSGGGKTASGIAQIFLQALMSGQVGGFLVSGKGDLGRKFKKYLDFLVEPGVDFAPFQGFDANTLAIAFKEMAPPADAKNSMWIEGADNFIDHAAVFHEALMQQEAAVLAYARDEANHIERRMTYQTIELVAREREGFDTTMDRLMLKELGVQLSAWKALAVKAPEWLFTPANFKRVQLLINDLEGEDGNGVPKEGMRKLITFLGKDVGFRDPLPKPVPFTIKAIEEMPIDAIMFQQGWNNAQGRAESRSHTIHPDINKGTILDDTINFIVNDWGKIPSVTRGGFMSNVNQRINPLLRGKYLCNKDGFHWSQMDKGIDISRAERGEWGSIDLPESEHGAAAVVITKLANQQLFSGMKRRSKYANKEEMRAAGLMPVMHINDEFQDIVSTTHIEMQQKGREWEYALVAATQEYINLVNALGSENLASNLWDLMNTWIMLPCKDGTMERTLVNMPIVPMVKFNTQSSGIDFNAGFRTYAQSAFNNPNHPNYAGIKALERDGGGKLVSVSDEEIDLTIKMGRGGMVEREKIFSKEELDILVRGHGMALIIANRAGAPRVDIVKLNYVDLGSDDKRIQWAKI